VEVLQVAVKKQETKDKKKSKEKDAWAIGQSVYFIIVAMFLRCRFQVSPQCKKKKKKKEEVSIESYWAYPKLFSFAILKAHISNSSSGPR
jgi:hypothetical protein